MPLCAENPGMAPGSECYAAGRMLAQLRDGDDKASPDSGQRDTQTEEDQTEAEPKLPTCNGTNGAVGVDCLRPKG